MSDHLAATIEIVSGETRHQRRRIPDFRIQHSTLGRALLNLQQPKAQFLIFYNNFLTINLFFKC